jgi:hypothetical protein
MSLVPDNDNIRLAMLGMVPGNGHPYIQDLYGAFGCLDLHGTTGSLSARFEDTLFAFKRQLETFIRYLRTGTEPFAFDETVELMKIIIAGIRSREEDGRRVCLTEIP